MILRTHQEPREKDTDWDSPTKEFPVQKRGTGIMMNNDLRIQKHARKYSRILISLDNKIVPFNVTRAKNSV